MPASAISRPMARTCPGRGGADMIKSYPLTAPQLEDAILALRMNGEPIPTITRRAGAPHHSRLLRQHERQVGHRPHVHARRNAERDHAEDVPDADPAGRARQVHGAGPDAAEQHADVRVRRDERRVRAARRPDGARRQRRSQRRRVERGVVPLARPGVARPGQDLAGRASKRPTGRTPGIVATTRAAPDRQAEVWVRAVDAWGRTQPLDGLTTWNPGGWGWHGVDRVAFQVT